MEAETKTKSAGHINNAMLMLNNPKMNIENLNMETLNILVGANGSGKSFCLVAMWFFGYIGSAIVIGKRFPPGMFDLKTIAQHAMDNSFDSKVDGKMAVAFVTGAEIFLEIKEGTIQNISYSGWDDIDEPTQSTFLSSAMRTFESISMYLKFRKMIRSTKTSEDEILQELLKTFKLYDVLQIESMIKRMPYLVKQNLQDTLQNFGIKDKFISFGVDLEKGDFYGVIDAEGNKKYLSIYSKGEQSLINMTLSQAM